MPLSAVLSRQEFVEWLGGSYIPRAASGLGDRYRSEGNIRLVWELDAGPPSVKNVPLISIQRLHLKDFFAFTSTYVSTFSPLSAFFRIVPDDILHEVLSSHEGKSGSRIPDEFIGITIAEAYAQTGGSVGIEKLSIQAGLATISSSVIAAIASGYQAPRLETVIECWSSARELLANEKARLSADAISPFWAALSRAIFDRSKSDFGYQPYGRAIEFVRQQLVQGFSVNAGAWRELTRDLPEELRALADERNVAREEQVRKIDTVSDLLIESSRVEPLIREIVAGFLIARLSGGSFEYLRFCDPFLEKLPRTVLWFGLFASLQRDSNIMSIGDCLGRRLAQKVFSFSGPFSPPVCDIGYFELEAFRIDHVHSPKFRTDNQNIILVELLPGVVARYRTSREASGHMPGAAKTDKALLNQLRATIGSAARLIDRLENREASLFPESQGSPRGNEKRGRSSKN